MRNMKREARLLENKTGTPHKFKTNSFRNTMSKFRLFGRLFYTFSFDLFYKALTYITYIPVASSWAETKQTNTKTNVCSILEAFCLEEMHLEPGGIKASLWRAIGLLVNREKTYNGLLVFSDDLTLILRRWMECGGDDAWTPVKGKPSFSDFAWFLYENHIATTDGGPIQRELVRLAFSAKARFHSDLIADAIPLPCKPSSSPRL